MARAVGLFGFTGGFLVISPQLRQSLLDGLGRGVDLAQQYSPYSYAGIALAVLGGVALVLISGSSAR